MVGRRAKNNEQGGRTTLAKVRPPAQRDVIARPRLFALLNAALARPVAWLSAPGGSGKTMLIASYLQHSKRPYLWYQIDEGDADIASFFYYLTRAAASAHADELPLYTPEYQASPEVFARNFFRRLFAGLPAGTVLVFDNYQEAPAGAALHRLLGIAIQEAPAGCNVLVASREEPPEEFARLRAAGQLRVLGWEVLRLTPEETRLISEKRMDSRHLDDALLAALYAYTRGWAAGLVLLLEHGQHESLKGGVITPRTQEEIFNYFAGEIFARSEPELQGFLLKTSFLGKFTSDMAAALTGESDAQKILRDLSRRNYFTVENHDQVPAYEYHPLFRDFLMARARTSLPALELDRIRKSAADSLAGDGQSDKAARLLCEAKDWDGMTALIISQAPSLVRQGRWRTLSEWIGLLPKDMAMETPALHYWLGISLLPFDQLRAREWLIMAYRAFSEREDTGGRLQSWCGVVDSYVFEWGNFTPLDEWIDEFVSELAPHVDTLPDDMAAQVACNIFMAMMFRQPQNPELAKWLALVWDVAINSGDPVLRMKVGPHLLVYYTWWIGDLPKAAVLLEALRPLAESEQATPLVKMTWFASIGVFYWMNHENERCVAAMDEGIAFAEATGVHGWDMLCYSQAVFATLSAGDTGRARIYLDEMARLQHVSRPMDNAMYFYLSAWDRHICGEYEAARERIKTALHMAEEAGNVFGAAIFLNDYGRTLYYCGEPKAARAAVQRALDSGLKIGARTVEYLCYLMQAEMALLDNDEAACLEALRSCLPIGRVQGFRNHTWWSDGIMARLYVKAMEANIEAQYVSDMIRRRHLVPDKPPRHIPDWPWHLKIFTLGDFTLQQDGQLRDYSAKAQKKPLELLRALIAFGGKNVSQEQLSEALWPDAEADAAQRSLTTTLHRLRKLVGEPVLILREGRLSLDEGLVWIDSWAMGDHIARLQQSEALTDDTQVDTLLALYRGDFLAGEEAYWTIAARERLRGQFLWALNRLGKQLLDIGECEQAAEIFERGLGVDALAEPFYQGLMRALTCAGRNAEAVGVYRRCHALLTKELGVAPSQETERLYKEVVD